MADTDTFEYDVFLSHNRADKDWTRRLAARIERETWQGRTLKVFYDEWDIQPGDNIPIALEHALPKSRKIALVMSPDFFKSEWTESERAAATIFTPANRAKRLIPLLLRDTELPALVAPLKYIDFRDAARFEASFKQLLAFLREEPLPRGEGADDAGSPPHNPEIPRPPAIGFVARRDKDGHDLVQYVSDLLTNANAFVVLWGAGGIGKTALAAEIARGLPPSPALPPSETGEGRRVVWTSADGRADFSLGTLLDATVTQLGHADMRTLALDAKADAARNLLTEPCALLVLDNFETVAEAEQARLTEFLANAPCAALVTTRQMFSDRRARNILIDAMGDAEAREFVNKLIEISPRREAFAGLDVAEIIKVAAANPLVMEWVVAQIQQAQEPRHVFDELAHGRGDAAQRVFDRSFNLPYLGDDGRAALLALTLFTPNASRNALAEVAGLDAERVDDSVMRLVSLRLADTDALNARVGVAGLTRELAKAHIPSPDTVGGGLGWGCPQRFISYFVRCAEAHAQTTPEDLDALEAERENLLAAMDVAFAAQDWENVMKVMDALLGPQCNFLEMRGYWDDAIVRGEQAAEAARRAKDDWHIGSYSNTLGSMAARRGDYESARKYYEQAVDIAKKIGAEQGLAATLHELGIIAQDQGDYEMARQRYAESLEIAKKLGNQSGIASTLHQLGNISYQQGDYETARQRYAESLEIEKKLGSQSGIAGTLHQLGMIAHQQGDYEIARQRYAESLAIKRRLGDQSGIAQTLHNLGAIAQDQGDYETARQRYAESLEIEKKLGSQSGIAGVLHQLGNISYQQGDYETARQRYTESLEITKKLGDQSMIASTLHQLGMIAQNQGDYETARQRYAESLEIRKRLGDQSGIAKTLHQLGMIAHQQGDYEIARQRYAESLEIKKKLGHQSGIAFTLAQLALLEEKLGNLDDARRQTSEALEIFRRINAPHHVKKAENQLKRIEDAGKKKRRK